MLTWHWGMMFLIIFVATSMPMPLTADTSEAATYLMCDPVERLVEIQVCDYSNSPYGGICFYELRERPFRTNAKDLRSLLGVTVTSLPGDKERELHAFLATRKTLVSFRPSFEYGMQPSSQLVPAYQRFTVRQKMLLCGPYAVPTPEVVPTFDVLRVDRWIIHPPSKKHFYLSSDIVTHSLAEEKCEQMSGHLAMLNNAGQFNFVASIAVLMDPSFVTSHGWWTGAVNFKENGETFLQWENGVPQYSVITYPNADVSSDCVVTLFHLRAFGTVGCDSSSLRYVCEKASDVA